jgi:hypothetical protein
MVVVLLDLHLDASPNPSSTLTNPPGSMISVPPYVTRLPVRFAHSSRLPYST